MMIIHNTDVELIDLYVKTRVVVLSHRKYKCIPMGVQPCPSHKWETPKNPENLNKCLSVLIC